MIPFFTEYTAPDGTTRRPLVERVKECRPCIKHDGWFDVLRQYGDSTNGGYAMFRVIPGLPESTNQFLQNVAASFASDLCAIACIRWLISHGLTSYATVELSTHDKGSHDKIVCTLAWGLGDRKISYGLATNPDENGKEVGYAHALNALCHAVADEIGVAP